MVSPLDRPILVPMWCVSLQAERQLPFSNGDALSPSEFSRGLLFVVFVWLVFWCWFLLFLFFLCCCFSYYWEFKSSTHSFHLTGVMWPCVSFRCGDRRRHSWLRRDKGAVLAVLDLGKIRGPGQFNIYIYEDIFGQNLRHPIFGPIQVSGDPCHRRPRCPRLKALRPRSTSVPWPGGG